MIVAELRNVTKRYGPVTALAGVDLEIARGQIVALLGPNGAGKTTAVRILLGLGSPDSGEARIYGRDPRESGARRRMGSMLQLGRVPETLRVRELISLFSSYYPDPLPSAMVIEIAGLEGLEKRLAGKLSGGQRQRLLFALAVCGKPDLLMLDEPTSALDVESRRSLWTTIRNFVARGGSILLTTHYLEEADALADHVIMLNRGSVVAAGSPFDIKTRATVRRIRCVTSIPRHLIESFAGVSSVSQSGASLEIFASHPERVVHSLLDHDSDLHDLEVSAAALEDAFLAITSDTQIPLEAAR